MIKLVETTINEDGKIRIPADIHLPWTVTIYITEFSDTAIHESSAECMFCGNRQNLINIHSKAVCIHCQKAILNNEFVDMQGELVINQMVDADKNDIILPPGAVRDLNSTVLLMIHIETAEISVIPAVQNNTASCTLCGQHNGPDQHIYKLGKDYFCFDCLTNLQKGQVA